MPEREVPDGVAKVIRWPREPKAKWVAFKQRRKDCAGAKRARERPGNSGDPAGRRSQARSAAASARLEQ